MVSFDLKVGFRGKPEGLEAFLIENGYELDDEEPNSKVFLSPPENDIHHIILRYVPNCVVKEDDEYYEDYEWKAYPDITSQLDISADPIPAGEEAIRIATLTAKKFNGVYNDPNMEEYYEAGEL